MNNKDQIFITGTTGMSGGFAVTELNQRGFNLRIMTSKQTNQIQSALNTYVEGDLSKLNQLQNVSNSNAGVIHYACASIGGKASSQVDIDAMEVLLNNWEQGPFTFISSLDVYGAPNTIQIVDESYPLSGHMNDYAAGKIACEELLTETAKRRGRTDFTIFRAPWIFAPSLASKQHIQRRFINAFKNEITLPGVTQAEWEKNIDAWVDARDLAWLVTESVTKPLGGAGNVIGSLFNWHDFFNILNSVAHLNLPIIHKSPDEMSSYAAELFGQTCIYSGNKVNNYYLFKSEYKLEETLQEAFLC